MFPDSKRIIVRRDLRELAAMRDEVSDFLGSRSLPLQSASRAVLAVDEAVSNIIIHNNSDPSLPPIEVELSLAVDRVEVSIRDAGKMFDPCTKSLAGSRAGARGLGLHLIHRAMDEVNYRFLCGRYNELKLVKYAG